MKKNIVMMTTVAGIFFLLGALCNFASSWLGERPIPMLNGYTSTGYISRPAYDSGWLNITDKAGQYFNVTHNLNRTEIIVDITGKTTVEGGVHQRNLGLTGYIPGWSRTYGGPSDDIACCVVQTVDGGYALAGYTKSFGAGNADFWMVKTDVFGNSLWNRTFGGTGDDSAVSMVQTSDYGYSMAGSTWSYGAGHKDFWLVKTDVDGNMEWNRTYGGPNEDEVQSMIQTDDEGYAVAGLTESFGAGLKDFWVVKTDSAGNVQWNKTYGGPNHEYAQCIIQTRDGGYAITGHTRSFGGSDRDFWLVKTDPAGNMEWNRTYEGIGDEMPRSVVQTNDNGYAIAGYTAPCAGCAKDIWLVRTDLVGNLLWNRTYGGENRDDAVSVVQTSDGGFVIASVTDSFGAGDYDFWLVKTDINGNMQWNKTYGGSNLDEARCVIQTSDGGYAITGETGSFGAGGWDFWLVKIGIESGLTWTDSTPNIITIYRGVTDPHWNYVRVRIWKTP